MCVTCKAHAGYPKRTTTKILGIILGVRMREVRAIFIPRRKDEGAGERIRHPEILVDERYRKLVKIPPAGFPVKIPP